MRENFVPFPDSQFDRKQAGQMLVVPPYLQGVANTHFLSFTGEPGDAVNLDSRIQEVSNLTFDSTVSSVSVPAAPYRVYRVQVPVEQIAWEVRTTAMSGNPNVCVRRDNVPAEFDNDAFSEVGGATQDSVTLVPDFLTDGTWFITVYGTSAYTFHLRNGPPTISDIAFTDTKINDETNRAGWRFYKLYDIPSQLGSLGWELNLANQVPGTEIAIRRNAVPSRWRLRTNGNPGIGEDYRVDASGTGGFLQRPGHQADIWYVGIYTPTQALGAFTLTSAPIVPTLRTFDGGTQTVSNQEPGRWKFVRIDVPAGVLGWDVRLRDVSGPLPVMVVRRDQLPGDTSTSIYWPDGPNPYVPSTGTGWPSGHQWAAGLDWTGRSYEEYDPLYTQVPQRLVMSMGRPLEPGTYYVGVYNSDGTNPTSYTIDSRGIGAGQTYPITATLAYNGGSATITNLTPREAKYFKVTIPASTPSWEVTLAPSAGEMLLLVRRGTVPDFAAAENGGAGVSAASGGDWEVKMQKAGPERYVMLPPSGEDYLVEGDYYLAVVSEGANPPNSSTIGTGTSSAVLTSLGPLTVTNLGAATPAGVVQPVSLAGGQIKAYQFSVPPGTASLEVRLDNRVGNPWMSLVEGTRLPAPPANYVHNWYEYTYYGYDGGTGGTAHDQILTVANPMPGTYSLCVRASFNSGDNSNPNASADLVVRQKTNLPLNFAASLNGNGNSHTDSRQMIDGEYQIYQVTVPMTESGQPVVGWIIKTDVLQGTVSLQVYKNFADPASGLSVNEAFAVIVPPFLTLNDTWYVRVRATGLTNYTITSRPVTTERPVWQMPVPHNVTFGDSGNDSGRVPLPGDQGVDLGQGEWHFYAVDVPEGDMGLLRTELQAISGNPDLYICEDGVPTTSHNSNPPYYGSALYQRSLTGTVTEYGNWVPLDGKTERQLAPGRWYLGVKAGSGSNVRYRLRVSTGTVQDLALDGGAASNHVLADNDWRYYRFSVPADAPATWSLNFSQIVGDVVMWLRDTVPPGQGNVNYVDPVGYYYGFIRTWYSDSKNQGLYSLNGHDSAGTYDFTTPPLRPGHTYYVGFRSNNSATFSVSSSVSAGVGVPTAIDFTSGSVTTNVPGGDSLLYRVVAPADAARFKYTATHSADVQGKR